jgi:hypothetical protein
MGRLLSSDDFAEYADETDSDAVSDAQFAAWWSEFFPQPTARKTNKPQLRLITRKTRDMAKERKLVEVTSDLPDMWEPQPNDVLKGIYVGPKRLREGSASSFLIHMVQDEETGEILSFTGKVADRKLTMVKLGTYVEITYLGETLKTSNGMAKDFKILSDERGVSTKVVADGRDPRPEPSERRVRD